MSRAGASKPYNSRPCSQGAKRLGNPVSIAGFGSGNTGLDLETMVTWGYANEMVTSTTEKAGAGIPAWNSAGARGAVYRVRAIVRASPPQSPALPSWVQECWPMGQQDRG